MRITKKIISVLMIVAMVLSLFSMNIYAANIPATLQLTAEETDSTNGIYKVTVSIQCDNTLESFQTQIYFDKTAFKLIRNTGVADTTATNSNGYKALGDLLDENTYDGETAHSVYGTDTSVYNSNYGYALGVGTGSISFYKSPATAAYGTLDTDKYQCIIFAWDANFDDNALLLDCSTMTPVFYFYLQKIDTAVEGETYSVGFFDGGKKTVINYDPDDAIDSYSSADPLAAVTTVSNAKITIPSASTGPVVDKSKAQVKMTPTSATEVADEFKLRVISTITDSDYDTYFANSGDDTATANAITELGMVAYKGDSFDYDTAVAVAKGTSSADGYAVGTTDYLSKKSNTADGTFGTIILLSHETCTNDVTYIGYVKYLDSEGAEAYAFYETSYTAAVSTNYTSIVSNYLKAYPYGA